MLDVTKNYYGYHFTVYKSNYYAVHLNLLQCYMSIMCVCAQLLSRVQIHAAPWTIHGILQARILEWVKVKVKSLSRVRLFATPWTVTY